MPTANIKHFHIATRAKWNRSMATKTLDDFARMIQALPDFPVILVKVQGP
jgi:hypothetical protein